MSPTTTEERSRLRALIVQHEDPTPAGHFTDWLVERGGTADVYRIDLQERDVDPAAFDVIVSCGSEFAAFDDSKPFVRREVGLLGRAVDAGVPVLGLCFGGQLLARVLGGHGFRANRSEIGWLPVRSRDPDLVPEGPWFQWHFDSFTLPEGTELIAESDVGPQAFVAGRHLGLQFHPEVTVDVMDEWVRVYRHELDADGVDPDALLEETKRRASDSKRMAWQLFDRFADRIASRDDPHSGGSPGEAARVR
jgi:GMP synthase-like glutamine amidotransferase